MEDIGAKYLLSTGKEKYMHAKPNQKAGNKGYYPGLAQAFAQFTVKLFFGHAILVRLIRQDGFTNLFG